MPDTPVSLSAPDSKSSPSPLASLVGTLADGATRTPPWYLDHQERWRWVVETLMGHPQVRGGQRPRDFPADSASLRAVASAVALHQCPVSRWGQMPDVPDCRFGSWLLSFVLMIEGNVLKTCTNPESACSTALQWVTWQVLRAMGQDADEAAFHHFLATIGIAPNEWPLLQNLPPTGCVGCPKECKNLIRIAAQAAHYAGIMADPDRPWQLPTSSERGTKSLPDRETVKLLLATELWLIRVKPYKVQDVLSLANTLWVARGASAWISQALAAVREAFPTLPAFRTQHRPPLLITDVDAMVGFAGFAQPSCSLLHAELMEALRDGFQRQNPKLMSFLHSNAKANESGLNPETCLPGFCIDANRYELHELSAVRPWKSDDQVEEARNLAVGDDLRCTSPLPGEPSPDGTCAFVKGDQGCLSIGDVPWRKGQVGNPRIGWRGIAWSLAGATYKAHTLQGLGLSCNQRPMRHPENHSKWLKLLQEGTSEDVAYLKLDGDRVGRNLGTVPYLLAVQTGLELLAKMQQGLRQGILRACAIREDGSALQTLPVELVYLGGDDLWCDMPSRYLQPFLGGFAENIQSEGAKTFTGAAVIVPALSGEPGRRVQEVVVDLVPGALKWAKSMRRAETPDVSLDALKDMARQKGFSFTEGSAPKRIEESLQVWEFRLEPI